MNNMSNCLEKEKVLINSTVVYFIGNVLTQLLSIALLKMITGNVTTTDYGYFNLIVTIDNLVTPILTLQIADAVFKFMIQTKDKEALYTYYTIGTSIIISGALVVCFVVVALQKVLLIEYPILVSAYIISTNIFSYNQRVVRALGKNKAYVFSNLIKSILCIILQFFFLSNGFGVKSLFLANTIATLLCVFILIVIVKTYRLFRLKCFDVVIMKEMLRFSVPLIPNTAVWWFQSSVNSLIITSILGVGYFGVYSIANKFASILNLVIGVFNMAWQESAIREYGTNDYNRFATDTFKSYAKIILSGAIILMPFVTVLMPYLLDKSYYSALPLAAGLILSTGFSAFSGYFGSIITAKCETKKLLYTNIVGVFANVCIVFTCIQSMGLWAIVISSIATNILLVITRYYSVNDIINLDAKFLREFFIFVVLCIINVLLCVCADKNVLYIAIILGIGLFIFVNRSLILSFISLIKREDSNENDRAK